MKVFFSEIRKEYGENPITVFLDNARYQRAYEAQNHAKSLHITLEFLPPYSPNMDLIE
jgi:transposase